MQIKRFIYATIDIRSGLPNLAAYQAGGIDAAPLELVCHRDIAAVVSAIDVNQFGSSLPGVISTGQQVVVFGALARGVERGDQRARVVGIFGQ